MQLAKPVTKLDAKLVAKLVAKLFGVHWQTRTSRASCACRACQSGLRANRSAPVAMAENAA